MEGIHEADGPGAPSPRKLSGGPFTVEPMAEAHGRRVAEIFNRYVTQDFAANPD